MENQDEVIQKLKEEIARLKSDFNDMYGARKTVFHRCSKCNHLREQGLICGHCDDVN